MNPLRAWLKQDPGACLACGERGAVDEPVAFRGETLTVPLCQDVAACQRRVAAMVLEAAWEEFGGSPPVGVHPEDRRA